MTNRQFVSDIKSANKIISSDALITDRAILSIANTCALILIKQQVDKRKLFTSSSLFTHIPCLEMTKVPLSECCEYVSEIEIARSKKKIPRIAEGPFGMLIQQVASVDKTKMFKESTVRRYANSLNLDPPPKGNYFWLYDDYIYVSNPDTKAIDLSAFFEEEPSQLLLCPSDCDCLPKKGCDPCKNPMDRQFKCPAYLLQTCRTMVEKELLTTYFNVPADRTSDEKDDQSKP